MNDPAQPITAAPADSRSAQGNSGDAAPAFSAANPRTKPHPKDCQGCSRCGVIPLAELCSTRG